MFWDLPIVHLTNANFIGFSKIILIHIPQFTFEAFVFHRFMTGMTLPNVLKLLNVTLIWLKCRGVYC